MNAADVNRYAQAFWRWMWLIALVTVVGAGSGLVAGRLAKPQYRATATIMTGNDPANPQVGIQDLVLAQRIASGYAALVTRQAILEPAVKQLKLPIDWRDLESRVLVVPSQTNSLLDIRVTDTDPVRAAAIANEIVRQLIVQSPTASDLKDLQQRQAFTQSQLNALQQEIQAAQADEAQKQSAVDSATSAREVMDLKDQIAADDTKIQGWRDQYGKLLGSLPTKAPTTITVVQSAQPPRAPVSPSPLLIAALAALAGLLLAGGGVFLLEFLSSRKVRSEEDAAQTVGVPSLGSVARGGALASADPSRRLVPADSGDAVAEAFRLIRTNLRFAWGGAEPLAVLVTSPEVGEGKSTVSANLAASFARAGKETILVDADLRHPTLHTFFGISSETDGLAALLQPGGAASEQPSDRIADLLLETDVPNLRVLPAGRAEWSASGELMASPEARRTFEALREMAEVVILDGPPVLPVADAAILAEQGFGVVMVAEVNQTMHALLRAAQEGLERGSARIVGVVANKAIGRASQSYRYYTSREEALPRESGRHLPMLRRG